MSMSPFNESLGTGRCVDAGVELVVKWMYLTDLEGLRADAASRAALFKGAGVTAFSLTLDFAPLKTTAHISVRM